MLDLEKVRRLGELGVDDDDVDDLLDTCEAALKVVEAAKPIANNHPLSKFTSLRVALEPFLINQAREEYKKTGGTPFNE